MTINLPVIFSGTDISDIQIDKNVEVFNTPSAELALSASTDPVVANETFTYQLDFGNTSAGSLGSTELRAFLPAGVTVSSISDGGTEVATGEVVWSAVTLGSGVSANREITVVADGATAGDILKLSAELTHDNGLEVDNRSEFAVTVTENASIASLLSANIAATPDPVASNGVLAYTITVTNGFGLPVDNVSVQFRVPTELSFHGGTDVTPSVTTGGGCRSATICDPTEEALWSLGTIAAGASQIITINAHVATAILNGTLIQAPARVTAAGMKDTINLQHTTAIQN